MFLTRKHSAQTLLEAILAISVIMIATFGSTTLVVSTIRTGKVSEDKVVAANLAREALEVVRGVRDSNWIRRANNELDSGGTIVQWDEYDYATSAVSLVPATVNHFACYYVRLSATGGWLLTRTTADATTDCSNTDKKTVYQATVTASPTTKFFTDKVTAAACPTTTSCVATKYQRIISIQHKQTSVFSGIVDYLEVKATVTWSGLGTTTYSLTEKLYDWR